MHVGAHETLYANVMRALEHFGDRTALIDGHLGKQTTFAEIKYGIERTAAALHERGFGRGDVFAICTPNCVEYPMMFHGINMAGGIVTTANPAYGVKELHHQLSNSKAKHVLVGEDQLETITKAAASLPHIKEILVLGPSRPGYTGYDELRRNIFKLPAMPRVDSRHDVAVIPYSSGTTGMPKGVQLTHRNLVANTKQTFALEKYTPYDNFIGFLPFFHIYGMMPVLTSSLLSGAKTTIMKRFDFETLLKIIQDHRVTYAHLVPPVVLALAKSPLVDKYDLSSLKGIICGAAPLSAELEQAVAQRLGCYIKQLYGMTELAPLSHINPTHAIKSGSGGVLVPNMEAKITDEDGKLLGPGQPGELRLRGDNVMKGYLNINDDSFDADGFYKTGDVFVVDEDGYFFVVDRIKELIKYKGFQVAPAELEAVLLSHDDIADACVVGKPDESAGEVPRAFVVLKPGKQLSADSIHAFVNEHVAAYKRLRGGVVFVESIPKTASGKVLRRIIRDQHKNVA